MRGLNQKIMKENLKPLQSSPNMMPTPCAMPSSLCSLQAHLTLLEGGGNTKLHLLREAAKYYNGIANSPRPTGRNGEDIM